MVLTPVKSTPFEDLEMWPKGERAREQSTQPSVQLTAKYRGQIVLRWIDPKKNLAWNRQGLRPIPWGGGYIENDHLMQQTAGGVIRHGSLELWGETTENAAARRRIKDQDADELMGIKYDEAEGEVMATTKAASSDSHIALLSFGGTKGADIDRAPLKSSEDEMIRTQARPKARTTTEEPNPLT